MYLKAVLAEGRRPAPWGKSSETWRKWSDLWMNWSTPAPRSSNSSRNMKIIKDILYMQLCLYLRVDVHVSGCFLGPFVRAKKSTLFLLWPLTLHRTLGYVTYQDIRSIGSLRDQTVIAVKAPADTQLEVPDTAGVRDHSMSLSLLDPWPAAPWWKLLSCVNITNTNCLYSLVLTAELITDLFKE